MALNHIVAIPISATSHLRQHVHLIFNLLKVHPSVIVTICMATSTRSTWDKELSVTFYSIDDMSDRLRIVEMDDKACEGAIPAEVTGINREIELTLLACEGPIFETILSGEGEGEKWSTRPCLIIPDSFIGAVRDTVNVVCDTKGLEKVPVVSFITTMAIALHRVVNDTAHHGAAEGMLQRYEKYRAGGMGELEAARKAFRFVKHVRLEWPDLPLMFDYEWGQSILRTSQRFAQGLTFVAPQSENIKVNADGYICVSDPEIDGESVKAVSSILGLPLIGLDPSTWNPPDSHIEQPARNDRAAPNFLDDMQARHGPKSVVYISFGTIIWPTLRPDIVEDMIDTLLESGIPFLVATASPEGKLNETVKAKIKDSGMGLIRDWVPQVRVLQHPAILTFITHCGMGSIMEAIVAQVAILTMPFHGDMAALAAHFTQIRKIGIPLDHFSANAGLELGNGTVVQDSSPARKAELAEALQTLRGPGGESHRQRLKEVKELLLRSRDRGSAKDGLLSISRWFAPA